MNDPMKDFVEKHREEFDHLEAPVLNLDRLKSAAQVHREVPVGKYSIGSGKRWLVAASVVIAITVAWLLAGPTEQAKIEDQLVQKKSNAPIEIPTTVGPKTIAATPAASGLAGEKRPRVRLADNSNKQEQGKAYEINMASAGVFARLRDSTSSSSRLLAILEIEKAGQVDTPVLDMLATTLNEDRNTNVRLAALGLLEKFSNDNHVSTILINSLETQRDPIVQLGLLSLLGKMKNVAVDDKLLSLASRPDTFGAVRDEAYTILLAQNKL
jgi:hypothetical protein